MLITAHTLPRPGRSRNEDAWLVREYPDGSRLAAVADGVGSAAAAGEASRRALELLGDLWATRPSGWSTRRALLEFVHRINRQLYDEALTRFGAPELVTTISVAALELNRAFCVNLGDSPIYSWRAGRLRQLSHHLRSTTAGEERMVVHALGLEADASPPCSEWILEPGDRLLLCSDGVSEPLGPSGLQKQFEREAAARSFVVAAREALPAFEAGDDATAVLIEIDRVSGEPIRSLDVEPALKTGMAYPDGCLERPLDHARRVWVATTASGRVLLKFPPLAAANDSTIAHAFLHEANQACRLDSPEFVPSRVPADGPLKYYIQDYIAAPSLTEVLQRGPLAVEGVLALAATLVTAAVQLAQRDLAHGDLKPDNILVEQQSPRWRFRVIDYGNVTALFSIHSRAGTPTYLAPERFQGAPISERTEIFSIGVVLYQALAGRPPFGEIEPYHTPRYSVRPKPLTILNPAVPPWLDWLVQRATRPLAEERYAHLSEIAHHLHHPEQIQPPHPPGAPLLERHPVRFYQLLAGILLILNLVQLWLHGRSE